jgi:hypothetical protein
VDRLTTAAAEAQSPDHCGRMLMGPFVVHLRPVPKAECLRVSARINRSSQGTCRANGIEPHAYLTHLYTEMPKATTVEQLEALLPWNVKPLHPGPRAPDRISASWPPVLTAQLEEPLLACLPPFAA